MHQLYYRGRICRVSAKKRFEWTQEMNSENNVQIVNQIQGIDTAFECNVKVIECSKCMLIKRKGLLIVNCCRHYSVYAVFKFLLFVRSNIISLKRFKIITVALFSHTKLVFTVFQMCGRACHTKKRVFVDTLVYSDMTNASIIKIYLGISRIPNGIFFECNCGQGGTSNFRNEHNS